MGTGGTYLIKDCRAEARPLLLVSFRGDLGSHVLWGRVGGGEDRGRERGEAGGGAKQRDSGERCGDCLLPARSPAS